MSLGSEVRTQLEGQRQPPQNSRASFTLDWWPGLPWQLLGIKYITGYNTTLSVWVSSCQPLTNGQLTWSISRRNNISRSLLWETWSNGWTWMNNSDDTGTIMNVTVTQYVGLFLLKWLVKCKTVNTHQTTLHINYSPPPSLLFSLQRVTFIFDQQYKSLQLDRDTTYKITPVIL